MKKMLAMMVVLGLVSAVDADIALVDNYDGTISIHLTEGSMQGYTMFLDICGGTLGAPGAMEDFKLAGTTPLNLVAPSATPNVQGHNWKYTGAGITGVTYIVGPVDFISDIPITVTGESACLRLTVPAGGTYIDGQEFETVIETWPCTCEPPEPMTMSLLGVGAAMALRRRRG